MYCLPPIGLWDVNHPAYPGSPGPQEWAEAKRKALAAGSLWPSEGGDLGADCVLCGSSNICCQVPSGGRPFTDSVPIEAGHVDMGMEEAVADEVMAAADQQHPEVGRPFFFELSLMNVL